MESGKSDIVMLGRSELENSSLQRGHKSNIHNRDLTIKSHRKQISKLFKAKQLKRGQRLKLVVNRSKKKNKNWIARECIISHLAEEDINQQEWALPSDRPEATSMVKCERVSMIPRPWSRSADAFLRTDREGASRGLSLRDQRQWIRVWACGCWLEFGLSYSSVG